MCTVTYLPLRENEWLLTSNRDESPLRPTLPPVRATNAKGIELVYPQDSRAGGTWMAMADDGRTICLLNGAFHRHTPDPPYRKSRGLVALDIFEGDSTSFFEQYDLHNIEPFTMVVAEKDRLYDFRWDGLQRHLSELSKDEPHIWASPTLYTSEYIAKRKEWFAKWLQEHTEYDQEDIVEFHSSGGDKDMMNGMVMNRFGIVRTVSITSILRGKDVAEMSYLDILKNITYEEKLNLKNST